MPFGHVEEVFPGGSDIGTLVFELGIGYLSAWIFNLLVIEVPRRREAALVHSAIGGPIWVLANDGRTFLEELDYLAQLPFDEVDLEQSIRDDVITRMCQTIFLGDSYPGGAETNLEFLQKRMIQIKTELTKIDPYISRLDVHLVLQLRVIQAATIFFIDSHSPVKPEDVLYVLQEGTSPLQTRPHFGGYARCVIDYVRACDTLKKLLENDDRFATVVGYRSMQRLWIHKLNDPRGRRP